MVRWVRGIAAGVLCVAVSACASAPAQDKASSVVSTPAPPIGEVTVADDLRAYSGVVSPAVDDDSINPVSEDPRPQLPATLTDAQGTKVEVTDTSRVLALDIHGTLARTVFELGMGTSLVGRDVSTQFDAASDLPLVTGKGHELNAEAILELDPTLIITDTSLGPWDVILQMRDAGIPVVVVESTRTLDNVDDIAQMTADALGVPDLGRELTQRQDAEISDVVAQIEEKAPSDNERLRTVFLYVRGGAGVYYMFGEGSGASDLIEAAGGYDVAAEIGWDGMRPVTAEGLISAAPEAIVMMDKGLDSVDGIDGLLESLPALAQTPAGQNKRIITMDDALLLGYGPMTAQVLNALAVALIAPEELA